MVSEPFLIAHSVRGAAAFDVAEQMLCPLCEGRSWVANADTCEGFACIECDSLGYWWIIPTSGHRAYPYWSHPLNHAVDWAMMRIHGHAVPEMPSGWPDHYKIGPAPKLDIKSLFKAMNPKPHIARRL